MGRRRIVQFFVDTGVWEIFKKYVDKSFSLTDCTSFVITQQLEITQVFTGDSHFRRFGFLILPSAEILPAPKA